MKLLNTLGLWACLTMVVCADATSGEASKPIWQPAVGDSWTYKVVVEVQEGSKLPANVEGQKIEKLDGKVRATYLQKNIYQGVKAMEEDGEQVHAFHVFSGKQLEEIMYMSIKDDAIEAVGTKKEGKNPEKLIPLDKAIPLVHADWKGGEAFPFMMDRVKDGQKIRHLRKFRVLGWETLETDAGKFKALHVQVTGLNGPMEIKRSYWFTPGVGFIKEIRKYYIGDKTIFTQAKVLEKLTKAEE